MAILTCPNCAVRVQPEDLICFRCGANLPRSGSAEEDLPTPTVSQKYLSADYQQACPHCGARVPDPSDLWCLECRAPLPGTGQRRISPVVLRIAFPTGNVEIPAGTSLLLGRDPEQSLVAAAFAHFDNVSRRHATVTVDDSGRATIRDEGSTNGTFVNDDRAIPGTEVRLVDGDRLRFGADVTGEVYLPRQEMDPANLSRNNGNV
jgi:pSer/pThr/pTyr-binding forkhead associated (FHA) protein